MPECHERRQEEQQVDSTQDKQPNDGAQTTPTSNSGGGGGLQKTERDTRNSTAENYQVEDGQDAAGEAVRVAGELIQSITFAQPQSILQQTLGQLLGMIQKQSLRMNELVTTNEALVADRSTWSRIKDEEDEWKKEVEENRNMVLVDRIDKLEGRLLTQKRNDDEEKEKQQQRQQKIGADLTELLNDELKVKVKAVKEELELQLTSELTAVTESILALTGRVASCENTCADLLERMGEMDERHGRSIEDMGNRLSVVAYDLGFNDDAGCGGDEDEDAAAQKIATKTVEDGDYGTAEDAIGPTASGDDVADTDTSPAENLLGGAEGKGTEGTEDDGTDEDDDGTGVDIQTASSEGEEDASLDLRTLLASDNNLNAAPAEAKVVVETSTLSRRYSSSMKLDGGSNSDSSCKDASSTSSLLLPRRASLMFPRRDSRRMSIAHASREELDYDHTLVSRLERLEESYDAMSRNLHSSIKNGDNMPVILQEEIGEAITQRVGSIEYFLDGYVSGAGDNGSDRLSNVLQRRDEQIRGDVNERLDPLSDQLEKTSTFVTHSDLSEKTSAFVTHSSLEEYLPQQASEVEPAGSGCVDLSTASSETADGQLDTFRHEVEESFRRLRSEKADLSAVMRELKQSEQRLSSKCSNNHSSAVESMRQLQESVDSFTATPGVNTSATDVDSDDDSSLQRALAVIDTSQAAIKSLEQELDALVSKLSEKPDMAHVKALIESVEGKYQGKLGLEKSEALSSLIEGLKKSIAQKMSKKEVMVAIKKAVQQANLGLKEEKNALMIGKVRYCLGCNSPYPGVNGNIATKVNHQALPSHNALPRSGRNGTAYHNARQRYYHVHGRGSGNERLSGSSTSNSTGSDSRRNANRRKRQSTGGL